MNRLQDASLKVTICEDHIFFLEKQKKRIETKMVDIANHVIVKNKPGPFNDEKLDYSDKKSVILK